MESFFYLSNLRREQFMESFFYLSNLRLTKWIIKFI